MKIFLLFIMCLGFISCSKDEDSNPAESVSTYVGTYQGTTSQSKNASIIVQVLNNKQYVTEMEIAYIASGTTVTQTFKDSDGLAEITSGSFSISLSSTNALSKITGVFTDTKTIAGTFNIDTGLTSGGAKVYSAGTFTLTKK